MIPSSIFFSLHFSIFSVTGCSIATTSQPVSGIWYIIISCIFYVVAGQSIMSIQHTKKRRDNMFTHNLIFRVSLNAFIKIVCVENYHRLNVYLSLLHSRASLRSLIIYYNRLVISYSLFI